MDRATEKAHRAVAASHLASLPEPPKKWRAEYDLRLMRALLSGGGLEQAIKATGYAATTCCARLRRLLPRVMSKDAKTALIAELEARAKVERDRK